MKYLLIPILMISTVSLGEVLKGFHHKEYEVQYEICKKDQNYNTQEQAFTCVRQSSIAIKILGTILFAEGSVLE